MNRMIELDKKYVFHIPKYKFEDNELTPIDSNILKNFITKLNENGYSSAYLTDVKSYYKNRAYDETLITLFTSQEREPEKIFKEFFTGNNNILKQEAFAYECNNRMLIETLTKI